jgi:hypothetical protein
MAEEKNGTTNVPGGASEPPKGSDVPAAAPIQTEPHLGVQPLPPSTPQMPPQPQTDSPEGKLSTDIAAILQSVKMPERRDVAPKRQIENKAAMFDTTLGTPSAEQPPAVAQEPVVPPPVPIVTMPQQSPVANAVQSTSTPAPVSTPKHIEADVVVPVHTLKDDLQHVVQGQRISVVRAVSLEEDRRARQDLAHPEVVPKHSNRTAVILFASFILLLIGGGALFGVYTYMQRTSTAVQQSAPSSSSILFAESSVAFPLDGQTSDNLKQQLLGARQSLQAALGSITEIVPTLTTASSTGTNTPHRATFSEFMHALGANPPDSLLRALSDNFFFGIHTVDINAPVIVVPVTSYDHAFAGMLQWESSMNTDLAPVFSAVPMQTTDQNGLPVSRNFSDAILRNYDIRALKDDSGQIRLYYSFPTQNVLVIAESPYSFAEILSRLQAQQKL